LSIPDWRYVSSSLRAAEPEPKAISVAWAEPFLNDRRVIEHLAGACPRTFTLPRICACHHDGT